MSDIELEGIYPIDDFNDLPIRPVPYGEGTILIKGNIPESELDTLFDMQIEETTPVAHVSLSVWEDSGNAARQDRQLLIGGNTPRPDPTTGEPIPMGRPIHVFDPLRARVYHIGEDLLPTLVEEEGYLRDVARLGGAYGIAEAFLGGELPTDPSAFDVDYRGLQRFDEPVRKQFGISWKADLHVGNLVFDVSLRQPVE